MLKLTKSLAVLFPALIFAQIQTVRAEINVVASIKPVHSLVAGVMKDVGSPHLLVQAGSPHTYALKPSDARALQNADMVIRVGPDLETFLTEPLKTLPGNAHILDLDRAEGVVRLTFRHGDNWQKHTEHLKDQQDHHGHERGNGDLHMWLDPFNAIAFVKKIALDLSQADPANAAIYQRNAAAMLARLEKLSGEITAELTPYKHKPYIVFHDAFQHFERRFGLNGVGSVTVSPEKQPGARHLIRLRTRIKTLKVVCVFAEPQFKPKLVNIILEGTNAHAGILDPIGAEIANGPELYFTLLKNNARSFTDCMRK